MQKDLPYKFFTAILIAFTSSGINIPGAQAKLGENIEKLKQQLKSNFNVKGDSVKDNRHYYMFTMNLTRETLAKAPGFSGGLTVTTLPNGTIIGQSMLMYLGRKQLEGRAAATLHALDFSLESLGRPIPKDANQIRQELEAFGKIIDSALAGQPQNIRYPNTKGKITVSKQPNGGLVLAATQD
jgi:hypothetical protein